MMYTTEIIEGKEWVIDETQNRAGVEEYGSVNKATESLKLLTNCSNCSNCSRCFDCSRCSRCSGCSRCSRCSDCFDCSNCSGCFDCSDKKESMVIPVIVDIHDKVYKAISIEGALNMSDWHTCDTTHCRAGWVTTLAGESGRKLESQTSTLFAAQQIYKASGYIISPVRFFDSNEEALADMKKLAKG